MKIAILDSGYDFSQILQNEIILNLNFTNESNKDENGHGTCIIKLIDSINSNIEFYILKILEKNCTGKLKSLKEALLEVIQCNVDIVNLSLGIETIIEDCELQRILEECLSRGIIIITSESNTGKTNYLSLNNQIVSIQGKLEHLNTNKNIIYMDNSPRILPWLGSTYILSGANSFLTPFVIKSICELFKDPLFFDFDVLKKYFMQQDYTLNISQSHQRAAVKNAMLMSTIEPQIAKLNLFDNSGALQLANVSPRCITQLVQIIESVIQHPYIYDSIWLYDLIYIENLINKIDTMIHLYE